CSRNAANCSALNSLIDAATALTPETIPPIAVRSGSSGRSTRSSRLRKASGPDEAPGVPDSRLARSRNSAASTGFRACASGTVTTPKGAAKIGTTGGAGRGCSSVLRGNGRRRQQVGQVFAQGGELLLEIGRAHV